jgi:hypothetical protein
MKPRQIVTAIAATLAAFAVIFVLLAFASGREASIPVGVLMSSGDLFLDAPREVLKAAPPEQIVKADVKYSWLSRKIEAVRTYRTLDDYRAGASQWFKVYGNSAEFPSLTTYLGLYAAGGVHLGEMVLPAPGHTRLVKLLFPSSASRAIHGGRSGALQARLLTQRWDTLHAGTKLQVPHGGNNIPGTLRDTLANLTIRVALTNTTSSVQSFDPAFWAVGDHDVLLYPFGILNSQPLPYPLPSIELKPSEVRVLTLETGYMFHKYELDHVPPAVIIDYKRGWEWKAMAYPSDPGAVGRH